MKILSNKNKKYFYLGAIHIHSIFSDGTGDINSISKSAKKAGLDWIIITDHNSFEIEEGIYNGVCVIKGEEISPKSKNHYLALGINDYLEPSDTPQVNIDNVRNNGGFGFSAHPDEVLSPKNKTRKNKWDSIIWTDKNIIPDGVEIWNWFSQWGDNLNDKNIFSIAYAYLFKNNLVQKPAQKTLKWWDELNNNTKEIIPAIGGVDAHALKIKDYILPVTIFPYKDMFMTTGNIIGLNESLANDFETQKKQILNAIKNGQNLIINRHISKNVPLIYIQNSNEIACSGECLKLDNETKLIIKTDKKYNIKILKNGIELKTRTTQNLDFMIKECGKYRIEIEHKDKGFIYSNPIIVY